MAPGHQPILVPTRPFPGPVTPPQPAPLAAINELMRLPWSGYIPAMVTARAEALAASLEGKVLAQNKHNINSNTGWDFALTLKDVSAPIDLANPPGFSQILPLVQNSGFTLEAPLTGSWNVGFRGRLEVSSKIEAGGVRLWEASIAPLAWNLNLTIKIKAAIRTDASNPSWPLFRGITVTPTLELQATEPIPLAIGTAFQVTVNPGVLEFRANLADLSVGIGNDFGAKLDLNTVIDMTPSPTIDFLGIKVPTADFRLALNGTLRFNLPSVGQTFSTSGLSASFGLPVETILPIPELLNQYLLLSDQQLPIQVGLGNPLGAVQAAPQTVDFATPAAEIESAAVASHLPYNAVFTIEHRRSLELPMWSALRHYATEEDSAIWTGHLLAAASFQYAATADPAALQLVNQILDGVDRLFTVCTDAVVKNGVRSSVAVAVTNGVRRSGFFARSVIPDDSSASWWEADDRIAHNNKAFYEQPEGGWDVYVPGQPIRHFDTYAEVQTALGLAQPGAAGGGAGLPAVRGGILGIPGRVGQPQPGEPDARVRPVGRVWYGIGAGGTFEDATTDHQLSRDQIIGVCLGLFTTWSLVSDQNVKNRAADRLTELIGYIVQNNWNVPLPPDMSAVCTSYLGAFDHQLALLRIGATVNPGEFGAAYDQVKAASEHAWISVWTTVLDPLFQYYKMNLSHAAMVSLLLAEQDATLRQNDLNAYNILRQATGHHRNAWFNLANILVQPPPQRAAYMATARAGSNPALLLTEEIKGILAEWLTRRSQVQEPNGLPTNAVSPADAQAIVDLWNNNHSQVEEYKTLAASTVYISKYARPVYQRRGGTMDFTWQSDPFSLGLSGTPTSPLTVKEAMASSEPLRECAGVDYLLPYWIAVYLGVITNAAPGPVPPPHP